LSPTFSPDSLLPLLASFTSAANMGGAWSKGGRKLPTKATSTVQPGWAGARAPLRRQPDDQADRISASETKSRVIQEDGADPQFLASLHRLGPVKVDHNMRPVLPGEENATRFRQHALSEEQAASSQTPRNRVVAASLVRILDERKSLSTRGQVEALAERYNMDYAVLEKLARFVTSPTSDPSTAKKLVTDEGSRTTMLAKWVDAKIAE